MKETCTNIYFYVCEIYKESLPKAVEIDLVVNS